DLFGEIESLLGNAKQGKAMQARQRLGIFRFVWEIESLLGKERQDKVMQEKERQSTTRYGFSLYFVETNNLI
ncbi:hypothetical protein ACQP3C_30120, partial [Escherichia coli]